MIALFLALTATLLLLGWAEFGPALAERVDAKRARDEEPGPEPVPPLESLRPRRTAAPKASEPGDDDAALMARLTDLLTDPPAAAAAPAEAPAPTAPTPAEALPRIDGFRPGDMIELDLVGPAPRAEDIRFEQFGRDVRVVIEGEPALILAQARVRNLGPEIFRFRSLSA